MKYLVTGVKGQLGRDVVLELLKRGVPNKSIIATDKEELDITDYDSVHKMFLEVKPDVVIHCAAYTQVDKAESESDVCYNVNVNGTKNITSQAILNNSKLVYISTDYVFDGEKGTPYKENDICNPLSIYGKTKLEGEEWVKTNPKHFILRTSWVFGENGNNFIKTMLKLSKSHDSLNVVCDQIGSPTYTKDLARLICDMIDTEKYGTYHATNEGYTSWADFAKYIFSVANCNTKVVPVTTEEYLKINSQQATRPKKSMLDKSKLEECGFTRLPSWKDATKAYIKVLNNENISGEERVRSK